MKVKVLSSLVILLFSLPLYPQGKVECYYDINISNNVPAISDFSIKNIATKAIQANMPANMIRSYDTNATLHFVLNVSLMQVKNNYGYNIGAAIFIYASLRSYPLMITALMPEDNKIGVTGDIYDISFISNAINETVANVFGQYDLIKELIIKYLSEHGTRE